MKKFKPEIVKFICPECFGDGEAVGAPCDGFGVWLCDVCGGTGLVTEKALKRYQRDVEDSDNG